MTSIAELLDRVRAATGPDWNLDGDLHVTLAGSEPTRDRKAPPYTASVDAALSLVERKLPGCWWDILDAATTAMWRNEADVTFAGSRIRLDRLPLALIAALLSALSNEVNHDAR